MNDERTRMSDFEGRLRTVEDELAIRNLVARFTDAVNQRDTKAFKRLWSDDAVWEIGPPFSIKATGVEAISGMLDELFKPKLLFVQLTHSGIIIFTGNDCATGRFTERERGKGEGDFYENLAVYHDEYILSPDGWRFKRRYYEYRFLDTFAFSGEIVPRTR
ncbi:MULTISPECIES: nuclear transport factor 2 family protein [unclassified Bradyrhizobium]|uniref:nuclear transport factor 2 family protein n=1 Tax=unclassified Bradyrhizobium TaxID=2631580 RepID=UPI001CD3D3A0|nr:MULTISPECIES: nuclear transport factor 2 family protein [unclassified Bradyrhizobium]MCA1500157.1 nuclear transport factor 2 family protein [Bradyrhizobium sp. NBAIM14]MCA1536651.1 nuclear transport factor 2 family protein [Bradyrhizobium sp. NBAIM03]